MYKSLSCSQAIKSRHKAYIGGSKSSPKPHHIDESTSLLTQANVFSISFDCDNRKLFSTGADATILMHDLETAASGSTGPSGAPTDVWIDHDDSVHAVRCHPNDPHLFMTASEDGTVLSFDTRTEGRAVGILAERTEMNDVVYHPLQPTQFATADGDGRVLLHDSRMAFGDSAAQGQLASEVAVLKVGRSSSAGSLEVGVHC